jgi:hypothetical protein
MVSRVTINGVSISSNGNVTIVNNRVMVDGKDVTPDAKEITISIEGNVNELSVDMCSKVSVIGDVGKVKTVSGHVDVSGDIKGYVETVSGDVNCDGSITGDVETISGDIKSRK